MIKSNNDTRELNDAELNQIIGGSSVATVAHEAGMAAAGASGTGIVQLYLRRAGGSGGLAG
jgi:bacteriocin-like protein